MSQPTHDDIQAAVGPYTVPEDEAHARTLLYTQIVAISLSEQQASFIVDGIANLIDVKIAASRGD